MDIKDAYKVLEVSEDISDEDLKKKYKELAKKFHPDKYSEDPNKFKKINEAFQLITDYREHPEKYQPQSVGGFWEGIGNVVNIADFFFHRDSASNDERPLNREPIHLNTTISFIEAVQGCERPIIYKRQLKCNACEGKGFKHISNGCDKCDGFGRVINSNKGFTIQQSCTKCYGRSTKKEQCQVCKSKRTFEDEANGMVAIPPGVENGSTLRINQGGNYIGRNFFQDEYTDVFVHIKVEPHSTLKMQGLNVICNLSISLLEALEGASKEIDTIQGKKTITIKSKTKNKEQLVLPKLGVKNRGDQIVEFIVEYPKDVSKLVEALKNV